MLSVKSILMVCRGNICRSPMAEGYFIHQLQSLNRSDITVTSAGITALVDQPADAHALEMMQQHGVDITKHRARQLTEELVRSASLILVMSDSQQRIVTKEFSFAKGKTFLLGHWGGFEVPDPYKQPFQAFEKTYEQVSAAWQGWSSRI